MLEVLRRSLRAKVIAAVFASTLAALLVSTVALLLYEVDTYRDFLRTDLTTQANILARTNAPALQFEDPDAAIANLRLLENRRSFEAAAVYTTSGEILASYSRDNEPVDFPNVGPLDRIEVQGGSMALFLPIVENDNRLGTVYLRAGYDLVARSWAYSLILVTVILLSLAVAALITLYLADNVTRPVQAVTRAARRVIEKRDFSQRVPKASADEIGVLVDAFNAMLNEVGDRTAELERTNRSLEVETGIRAEAEKELRVADRRKDEFLATLAHELRNPLAPLVNAISLIKSTGGRPDAAERSLAIIERQIAQLVLLVDDLLDVSRITSGKLEIRTEPVRLRDVVQSAVDTISPRVGASDHPVRIDLPGEGVYVAADRVRLAQILGNLLHNAVKFSKPGGAITLSADADDDVVRIRVSDEGVGIAAESLDSIFEMFTQNGAPVEQTQTGLGVGLALARQLAELHGGTVEAASAGAGKGSTFTVSIPRAARPAAEERSALPSSDDAGEAARVLVVDDNRDFAESLAELLKAYGHEVEVAYDGEHALSLAGEFRPQFGLLDIGLPRMDGYELARRLRRLPWADHLILVAISGWGQEQDRRRSREAGFALHLVKPVQYPVVQAALRGLLEERSA